MHLQKIEIFKYVIYHIIEFHILVGKNLLDKKVFLNKNVAVDIYIGTNYINIIAIVVDILFDMVGSQCGRFYIFK